MSDPMLREQATGEVRMARREESRRDYVLRAAAATKMADSCREPALRESLFELAEQWLDRAEEIDAGPPAGSRLQ